MILSLSVLAATIICQTISYAAETVNKYGVVNVTQVVKESQSVQALKATREDQKLKLENFVKDGNAKVDAETDPVKKEALKKKLNNDLKYMVNTYEQRYKDSLSDVNKEISTDISNIAKQKNYSLILTTDSVLYGGQNITEDVINAVK